MIIFKRLEKVMSKLLTIFLTILLVSGVVCANTDEIKAEGNYHVEIIRGYGRKTPSEKATYVFGSNMVDTGYSISGEFAGGAVNQTGAASTKRYGQGTTNGAEVSSITVYYGEISKTFTVSGNQFIGFNNNALVQTTAQDEYTLFKTAVSATACYILFYQINDDLDIVLTYKNGSKAITFENVSEVTPKNDRHSAYVYTSNDNKVSITAPTKSITGTYATDFDLVPVTLENKELVGIDIDYAAGKYKYSISNDDLDDTFYITKDGNKATAKNTSGTTATYLKYSNGTFTVVELAGALKLTYLYENKITFDANGGKFTGDLDTKDYVTSSNLLDTVETPINGDMNFMGWFDAADASGKLVDITVAFSSNQTLYAHWANANSKTITFVNAFGTTDGITSDNESDFSSFSGSGIVTIAPSTDASLKAYATYGTIQSISIGSTTLNVSDLTSEVYINENYSTATLAGESTMLNVKYDATNKYFIFNFNNVTKDINVTLNYAQVKVTYLVEHKDPIETYIDFNSNAVVEDTGLNISKWYTDDTYTTEFDFTDTIIQDTNIYAKSYKITLYKGHRLTTLNPTLNTNDGPFFGYEQDTNKYIWYTAEDFTSTNTSTGYTITYKAAADTVTLSSFDVYYGNSDPLLNCTANSIYEDANGNLSTTSGRQLLSTAGVVTQSAATSIKMRIVNNPQADLAIVWHYTSEFPLTINGINNATCTDDMPNNFKYDADTKTASYSSNFQNVNGVTFNIERRNNVTLESIHVKLLSGDSAYDFTIDADKVNDSFYLKKVKDENQIATTFEIVDEFVDKNNTPIHYNGSSNTITVTELANAMTFDYIYQSKITFDANDGKFTDDDLTKELITVNGKLESYPTKKDLVYEGYKFIGWFDQKTGGNLVDLDGTFDENKTVYAHWADNSINTITIKNAMAEDNTDAITSSDESVFSSFDKTNNLVSISKNNTGSFKAHTFYGTVSSVEVNDTKITDLTKKYYVNKDGSITDTNNVNAMMSIEHKGSYIDINITGLLDDVNIKINYADINIEYHILDNTITKQIPFNTAIPASHTPSVEEHRFEGFYYDEGLTQPYNDEKLLADTIIYCDFADEFIFKVENTEKSGTSDKFGASVWENSNPDNIVFDKENGTITFDGAWEENDGQAVGLYTNKGIVSKVTIKYGDLVFEIEGDDLISTKYLAEDGNYVEEDANNIFMKYVITKTNLYAHAFNIRLYKVNHNVTITVEYTNTITYDNRDGVDSRYNFDLYSNKTTFNTVGNIAYVDPTSLNNNIAETGDAGIEGGVVRLLVSPYADRMSGIKVRYVKSYDASTDRYSYEEITYNFGDATKNINNSYGNLRLVTSNNLYYVKFARLNTNVEIRPIVLDSSLQQAAVINADGTVKLNFVLHTFLGVDTEKAYVTFDDGENKIYLNTLSMGKDGVGSRNYTVSTENYNMQNIIDEFTVKFVDEDGNIIKQGTTSIASYLNTLIGLDTVSDNMKAFAKSMLNYGAYCQTLFDYKTDNLANKDLDVNDKDISSVVKDENDNYSITGTTNGIKPVGLNLSLNNSVGLNVYFNVDKDHDINNYTFTYNGTTLEPTLYSGRQYYVSINSVAAPNLSDRHSIVVTDEKQEGNLTVDLSVNTFVYLALDRYSEDESQTDLVNAMKALYAYGQSAKLVKNDNNTNIQTIFDDMTPYNGERLKIAFIGDSITFGYNPNANAEHVDYSYPADIARALGNKYEIGNFGKSSAYLLPAEYEYSAHNVNGQNERLSYTRTYEYQESINFNPDIVCIMLGTNDRRSLNSSQEAYEQLKIALTNLINDYKALESVKEVYVLTSIATGVGDADISEDGKAYVQAIRRGPLQDLQKEVAAECSCKVIDVYGATGDIFMNNTDTYMSTDKLHPKKAGYQLIADVILSYFKGETDYDATDAGLFYYNRTNDDTSIEGLFNYYMQGAADPFVLYEDGIFYMYPTSSKTSVSSAGGVDLYTSTDMVYWKHEPNKVFTPGSDKSWGSVNVWAPEVVKDGDKYYMYYSAHGGKTGENDNLLLYVSVAVSDSPNGKFTEYTSQTKTKNEPLIMFEDHQDEIPNEFKTTIEGRDGDLGFLKVIDASPFVDPVTNKKYLFMVVDLGENGSTTQSYIAAMEMEDWVTPKYETLTRITEYGKATVGGASISEGGDTNEGPSVCYKDGYYYLTFSTYTYENSNYQVRQAISTSPLGTYTKIDPDKGGVVISTSTDTIRQSAGHSSFTYIGNEVYLTYHTFFNDVDYDEDNENAIAHRKAAMDKVVFVENEDGVKVMQAIGTTSTPQLLPSLVSGYRNIATDAVITGNGTNLNNLNDTYVSLNGIQVRNNYQAGSGTNTITFTFDSYKTTRGVQIYNAADSTKRFTQIKKITLHTENGDVEYENIVYDSSKYAKNQKVALDQLTGITYYDTRVNSITIVFEEDHAIEIPEIMIIGK